MIIKPLETIHQNYAEISNICKTTGEPVFLTENGEIDLVIMDIETFNRKTKMIKLREELESVEKDKLAGRNGYTIDELDSCLDDIISDKLLSELNKGVVSGDEKGWLSIKEVEKKLGILEI